MDQLLTFLIKITRNLYLIYLVIIKHLFFIELMVLKMKFHTKNFQLFYILSMYYYDTNNVFLLKL